MENSNAPSLERAVSQRDRIAILEAENHSLAKRLREAEALFRDLTDNSHNVVSIVDGKLAKQIYVSPGYETLWDRPCSSLYADPHSWLEAVHTEDLPRVAKAWESPSTFNEEYRVVRGNGEIRWLRTRYIPIRNEASEVVRLVAVTEDIGDWKRLETQLIQSQKMDAIGRLAGGIAHDFNNLLTVINGYSALLTERLDLSEDVREDLFSIRRAGERATSLTAQLLSFSRKAMTRPKAILLTEAVADVEPMLRRLIRENVDLVTLVHAKELTVRVDPTQFEQVIMNLVINARDAIEASGSITIELAKTEFDAESGRLHGNAEPGHYASIAVSDTGRGMSAAVQERIFEPFFTTKELGQGTGLGLATAYGIVKQSGGTIWVYSEEGIGTTIKIYLPLAEGLAKQEPEPKEEIPMGGSATILLVEDDQAVRHIASEVLQKRGYRVIQAANGQEAERFAECDTEVNLLVTDVIMPKMGGRELAAKLAPAHPDMKVLFISGYTENAVIQLGNVSAGSNHLAKPFSPDALARKVSEILTVKTMTA
jgi:two-component system, cell cycle sensor histidine kinase and response regulator CckA